MPAKGLRAAAKAAGEKRYFTGVPCPRGHVAARFTNGGGCSQCAKENQRARTTPVDPVKNAQYQKKWNGSTKGYAAKMRWKENDPKNAWACSAVGGAKSRAKKKGLPFDLDKAYVYSILTDVCPVLGVPFVWYGQKLRPDSPSLDRIQPKLGYVRGNVVVVSQRANAIKSDASVQEIRKVADWLQRVTEGN